MEEDVVLNSIFEVSGDSNTNKGMTTKKIKLHINIPHEIR